MAEFTYEKNNTELTLETYEWDNPWWEHTENTESPRVLYIGDSISNGTRRLLNELADGKILFDGFATSKALDNPYYKQSLELFMSQQKGKECILFNNGLHGWHLNDSEYESYYREMISFLKKENVPVYVLTTTNLPIDTERNNRVLARNAIAVKIAEELDCHTVDLYKASLECNDLYCGDGVHFKEDGYKILANCILNTAKF